LRKISRGFVTNESGGSKAERAPILRRSLRRRDKRCRYLLKNVHAAIANNTTAAIQSDESLIPVFLAMGTS
jgi:uncharacterized SAM-dependent methyltransferase